MMDPALTCAGCGGYLPTAGCVCNLGLKEANRRANEELRKIKSTGASFHDKLKTEKKYHNMNDIELALNRKLDVIVREFKTDVWQAHKEALFNAYDLGYARGILDAESRKNNE